MMSFFSPRNAKNSFAYSNGYEVWTTYVDYWPPCMAYHRRMWDDFVEYAESKFDLGVISEDMILARYCSEYEHKVYNVSHGLAQHNLDEKSVVGNSPTIGKNRRDSLYYEPERDVYPIDWEYHFHNAIHYNNKYLSTKGMK